MVNEKLKHAAIEQLTDSYGSTLLAIYESGSHLHGIDTETSDYDLIAIVKAKKKDLIRGTLFASQIIQEDRGLDFLIMDEYKLLKLVGKGSIRLTQIFAKEPIYLSKEWEPTATYFKTNFAGVLFQNPVSSAGSLYGEFKSYVVKYNKNSFNIGAEFDTKPLVNALLVRGIYKEMLALTDPSTANERLIEAICPTGRVHDLFLTLRGMTTVKDEGDLVIFNTQKRKLEELLDEMEEVKSSVKDYVLWEGTTTHYEALLKLLLPPV